MLKRFSISSLSMIALLLTLAGTALAQTTQNFDSVTVPALPSGWTFDSGYTTENSVSVSSPNALQQTGNITNDYGTYNTIDGNGGNVTAAVTFQGTDTADSAKVFIRASALPYVTNGTTGYILVARSNIGLRLFESNGSGQLGASIGGTTAFAAATKYRLILTGVGSLITASAQRISDGFWLNTSGTWQSAQTAAITVTDNSAALFTGAGYFGLGVQPSVSTNHIYLDDFSAVNAFSVPTAATPTFASVYGSGLAVLASVGNGAAPYFIQFQRAPDAGGTPGTFVNVGTAGTAAVLSDTGLAPGTTFWYRYTVTDSQSTPGTATSSSASQVTTSSLGALTSGQTTVALTSIPGITIYSTEAAALAGAVDSTPFLNNFMASQSPTAAAPLVITNAGGGWLYCSQGLLDCPSGGNVTWNGVNLVFSKAVTCQPKMYNWNRVSYYGGIVDQNITLANCTFDFNYAPTDSQPKSDSNWGMAMSLVSAGVKNLAFTGDTFINPHTYTTMQTACDSVQVTGCNYDVGLTPKAVVNYDGIHFNGPCRNLYIYNTQFRTWDDAIALNGQEDPVAIASPDTQNYYHSPWFQGASAGLAAGQVWNGGIINNVLLKGIIYHDALHGIRLFNMSAAGAITNIIADGLSGSVSSGVVLIDPNMSAANAIATGSRVNVTNFSLRNMAITPFDSFHTSSNAKLARINAIYSVITNFLVDLPTCLPVNGDYLQTTTVPFFGLDSTVAYSGLSFGLAKTPYVSDNFNRANSAAGGVGGGSYDPNAYFEVLGNQLNIPVTNAGSFNLAYPSTPAQIGDAEVSYDYTLADYNSEVAGIQLVHSPATVGGTLPADSSYGIVLRVGTSAATSQNQTTKKYLGTTTNLTNYTFTSTLGHVYHLDAGHYGPYTWGELTDKTGGAPGTLAGATNGFDLFSDPALSSYSAQEVAINGRWPSAGGAWNADNLLISTLTPLTLSGHSVTCTSPSGGAAQASVTSLPAGAASTVGTWAISGPGAGSAVIDVWGRITGLATTLTLPVTVTYTADGFTGGVVINPDGSTTQIPSAAIATTATNRTSGEIGRGR